MKHLIFSLALLCCAQLASASIYVITANLDAQLSDSTLIGFRGVNTSGTVTNAQMSGHIIENIIWEYNISSIPSSETITSVRFLGTQEAAAGTDMFVDLTIYAYDGDGLIDANDRGTSLKTEVYSDQLSKTAVDTPFAFSFSNIGIFQTLLAGDGLVALSAHVPSFDTWSVASNENPTYDGVTLEITTVPEPAHAALWMGMALSTGLFLRRR